MPIRADAMRELLDGGPAVTPLAPAAAYQGACTADETRAPKLDHEEDGVRVYRTPRGLPIVVKRKPGAPLVHAGMYVLGGACEERDELRGSQR